MNDREREKKKCDTVFPHIFRSQHSLGDEIHIYFVDKKGILVSTLCLSLIRSFAEIRNSKTIRITYSFRSSVFMREIELDFPKLK